MIEYNKENPLRCFYAFAGYNSQEMALKRLAEHFPEFHHVCVGWSEIDANAIKANNAVFPEDSDKNFGDITKIDWEKVPDFDLFTYSFPCTNISKSGNQLGLEEGSGTSSSLIWECKKAIKSKKPRYLLMENVKALTQKKFANYLIKWQSYLKSIGYSNFTKIINSCDYGVPQSRERVFMISILITNEEPYPRYFFPIKIKLERFVKDVLEHNANDSFYLSGKALSKVIPIKVKEPIESIETQIVGFSRDEKGKVVSRHLKRISNTVTSFTGSGHTTDMYVAEPIETNKINSGNYNAITIVSEDGSVFDNVGNKYRIRKITPTDVFRLMDVDDDDIEKIKQAGIAKTNLYKLAGNSIVVSCMFHIFRKLFIEKECENEQLSLF